MILENKFAYGCEKYRAFSDPEDDESGVQIFLSFFFGYRHHFLITYAKVMNLWSNSNIIALFFGYNPLIQTNNYKWICHFRYMASSLKNSPSSFKTNIYWQNASSIKSITCTRLPEFNESNDICPNRPAWWLFVKEKQICC